MIEMYLRLFYFFYFYYLFNYLFISIHFIFTDLFLLFYVYSVTIVCIFAPSLHPTPANPTSLPHNYPPPWFCPCVLYSSSYRPLSPLPSGYCYNVLNFNVHPAIPLLGLYPKNPETPIQKNLCTPMFIAAQNNFWTRQFWCLLVFLKFFVSLLPHQQNISLWGPFLIQGNKKTQKCCSGWDPVNREGGAQGSKTAEHSVKCGQVRS